MKPEGLIVIGVVVGLIVWHLTHKGPLAASIAETEATFERINVPGFEPSFEFDPMMGPGIDWEITEDFFRGT